MSGSVVASFEKESFRKKLTELYSQAAIPDAGFADAIYTATSRFGIGEVKFRDAFGLAQGATERWMQMKNLPQPIARPKIIRWIADQL